MTHPQQPWKPSLVRSGRGSGGLFDGSEDVALQDLEQSPAPRPSHSLLDQGLGSAKPLSSKHRWNAYPFSVNFLQPHFGYGLGQIGEDHQMTCRSTQTIQQLERNPFDPVAGIAP